MHAEGKGQEVSVGREKDYLKVIISDDGPGFDPSLLETNHERLGLVGMRERVESMGGEFQLESSSQGTRVYAEIPLRPASEKEMVLM